MNEGVQYITQESRNTLEKERENLKNTIIPDIANKINEAKQQGDLSENAEYHQAKEEMAWAQGRFFELERILQNAEVISKEGTGGAVNIGSTVTVKFNGKQKEYMITGSQEANPLKGLISNESPLGQAFLGKKKGDTVEVSTPSGKQVYQIVSVV